LFPNEYPPLWSRGIRDAQPLQPFPVIAPRIRSGDPSPDALSVTTTRVEPRLLTSGSRDRRQSIVRSGVR
jgi:hypothetical protein